MSSEWLIVWVESCLEESIWKNSKYEKEWKWMTENELKREDEVETAEDTCILSDNWSTYDPPRRGLFLRCWCLLQDNFLRCSLLEQPWTHSKCKISWRGWTRLRSPRRESSLPTRPTFLCGRFMYLRHTTVRGASWYFVRMIPAQVLRISMHFGWRAVSFAVGNLYSLQVTFLCSFFRFNC